MNASQFTFRPATEIQPAHFTRDEELEARIRELDDLVDRQNTTPESTLQVRAGLAMSPSFITPEEWQSLKLVINDLLVESQAQKGVIETQRLTIQQLTADNEQLRQKQQEQEIAIAFQEKRLDKHSEYILDIKDRMDPEPQPKQKNQSEILRLLLAQNNGKMLKADARHKMGLSKSQFSDLLSTMSGLVESKPLRGDRRSHVLILIKNKELVQLNY